MRTLRRILFLLLALAMVLTFPLTAGAKGKPTPLYYEVTMGLVGTADGLATTCEAGPIKMRLDPRGILTATGSDGTEVPRLFVKSNIPWVRDEPYFLGSSGTGFFECHGGQTPGSTAEWGGNLMISIDQAGTPTKILWHFDHLAYAGTRGKPVRTILVEAFTLGSVDSCDPKDTNCQPFTWDAATKIASGTFALSRWIPGDYIPLGTSNFKFTLTLDRI